MTESDIYPLSKPVRLYVKQCNHCHLRYFGKTQNIDIHNYPGSGLRWTRHLQKHNAKPITVWVSEWFYDSTIIEVATEFSKSNHIVESSEWANIAIENGIQGGHLGNAVYENINIEARVEKYKNTVANEEWKRTTGRLRSKRTVANTDFVELGRKVSLTKQTPEWQSTIGADARKKMSAVKKDPIWKEQTGKPAIKKAIQNRDEVKMAADRSLRMMDPEWRNRKHKTCVHCGKTMDPMNYGRYHGDKCKLKEADLAKLENQ